MTPTVQVADFDMQIGEILLVHRNTFVHRFKWTAYRSGRMIDGLSLCVSGSAVFDCGDTSFSIKAGQMVFLSSASSYILRCNSEEPFIHYTINFRIEGAFTAEQTAFSEILAGRLHHITSPDNEWLYLPKYDALLSTWQNKKNGYRVMSKAILYEILYLYFTDAGRQYRNKDEYNRLLPAKRVLDNAYQESQRIAELAALCDMSETSFRRMFTNVFAMSPTEYRLHKRILRAKDLLLSGQFSVNEAAKAVGFTDPNYFTRVFRAKEGITPSEFMRG